MEERIINHDDGRKIKVKRTAAGNIEDAVEESLDGAAQTDGDLNEEEENVTLDIPEEKDEDVVFEIPEGAEEDYDESMVGLTPTQLLKALEEKRKAEEKAREECAKLLASANEAIGAGDYAGAEAFFTQALVYDEECLEAKQGLWSASTHNFKDLKPFYEKKNAQVVAGSGEEVKSFIRARAGDRLSEELKVCKEEAEPLSCRLSKARQERREAFESNRSYYRRRFAVVLAVIAVFAVAAGISAIFIFRTTSYLPLILTVAFGVFAFAAIVAMVFVGRKLYVASRLCTDNEKMSSTEDGKRLQYLQNRIECLELVLNG